MSGLLSSLAGMVRQAGSQYPFINQFNPLVSLGRGEGYAETWPANETGDASYPRPEEFPMDRIGVQVFRPDAFGPSDLAAEMLHVDPRANEPRARLLQSLTPSQIATLKAGSGDYQESMRSGQPERKALENAVDAAMRGYTVNQWPQSANDQMNYMPAQRSILDHLRNYMLTGKDPDNAFRPSAGMVR